jgi:hypothetical protein
VKKGLILILCVFFLGLTSVKAAKCENKEQADLNNVAAQVKASYEVKEGTVNLDDIIIPDNEATELPSDIKPTYTYLSVSLLNITEKTYVTITSEAGFSKTITYASTSSGLYSFEWTDLSKVNNLTITVYSSDKTGCPNEKIRVFYLKLPKSNEYASSPLCSGNEGFYLCKPLITTEEPDYNTFETKLKSYMDGKINKEGEDVTAKAKGLTNTQIILISVGVAVLVVGVVSVIALKKKRRIKR